MRTGQIHFSKVGSGGRTTIPLKVREGLHIKPGDWLQFIIEDGRATVRVAPSILSLKGALASTKGRGMTFSEIRRAAARRKSE
jgi:AbrB family looped-hinge helix DNA binding protein